MLKIIRNFLSQLLSRPSVWAISYIACIFIFAWVYKKADPKGFYHSTVKYEQETNDLMDQASKIISRSVRNASKSKYENVFIQTPKGVYLNKIIINGEEAKFRLRIGLVGPGETISHVLPFRFEKDYLNNIYKTNNTCVVDVPLTTSEEPPLGFNVIHTKGIQNAIDNPPKWMRMSCNEAKTIKKLFAMVNGFPGTEDDANPKDNRGKTDSTLVKSSSNTLLQTASSNSSSQDDLSEASWQDGSYERMLYFSAVTITTLGFGDIVPISDKNRRLVTLESILGAVFIGLFLNALANKANRHEFFVRGKENNNQANKK
ncbi:MAG: potassium channel family protein [Pseudodesulfovibrio sp.]